MRVLIEDTRQKDGKHDAKHAGWEADGVELVRCALPWGDYALPYAATVDTKKDIYELWMDIRQDHARFRRECIGARNAGCQLWVLVENRDGVRSLEDLRVWRESDAHFAKRRAVLSRRGHSASKAVRFEGAPLAKACETMAGKYGVRFAFCAPEEAHLRVVDILEGREPWPPAC